MGYEIKIKWKEPGIIDSSCYSRLTAQDWSSWIEDRLHFRDTIVPYEGEGLHNLIFRDIAESIGASVELSIQQGIRLSLDSAYKSLSQKKNSWSNKAIDDLLLLTNSMGYVQQRGVEHPFFRDGEKIKGFLSVLIPRPELDVAHNNFLEQDLYSRVLQTLVAIDMKLPYQFWSEQLAYSRDKYAHFCFLGAINNSLEDGLKILHEINWESEITRQRMGCNLHVVFMNQSYSSEFKSRIVAEAERLSENGKKVIVDAYRFVNSGVN